MSEDLDNYIIHELTIEDPDDKGDQIFHGIFEKLPTEPKSILPVNTSFLVSHATPMQLIGGALDRGSHNSKILKQTTRKRHRRFLKN